MSEMKRLVSVVAPRTPMWSVWGIENGEPFTLPVILIESWEVWEEGEEGRGMCEHIICSFGSDFLDGDQESMNLLGYSRNAEIDESWREENQRHWERRRSQREKREKEMKAKP